MVPGNARPSSSAVRRAPTTTARTASEPQRAQRSAASIAAAPPADRPGGVAVRTATAAPCSAGTARWCGTARTPARARSRAGAPAPAPGAPRSQRRPRGPQRHRRQPRGARGRVALLGVAAVVERDHPGRAGPHHRPGGHQVVGPAAARPAPAPRRCGRSRRSSRRSAIGGPAASRPRGRAGTAPAVRPGCRRRRPRPSPDRGRSTGANTALRVPMTSRACAAQHRQPAPVALPTGPAPPTARPPRASSTRAVAAACRARRRRAGRGRRPAPRGRR